MKKIWFKFYSADYLLDSKIDALPLEAQAVVIRMWCVLHRDGRMSPDPKEISRLCRVPLEVVQMHLQNIVQMFLKDADGLLYSKRMDEEMERSERISVVKTRAAKLSHIKRVPANACANDSTNVVTNTSTKTVQSESESDIKTYSSEPKVSEPSVIEIPLNDNTTYGVSSKEVKVWTQLYPSVDVMQQLRNMIGWSMGNPSRRKTRRGIQRFITSWLARAQDTGKSFTPPADQFNLTGGLDQVMANRRANGFH